MRAPALSVDPHVATTGRPAPGKARVVVAWHRFGPYHHARLHTAACTLPVVGLEISTVDRTYQWAQVEPAEGVEIVTAFKDEEPALSPGDVVRKRLWSMLDAMSPDAVAIPGWGDRYSSCILAWAVERAVPRILMSDSTAIDAPRRAPLEWVKSRIVRCFSSAFVGGTSHVEYVASLGTPRVLTFVGYDVVDNAHFEAGARAVSHQRDSARARLAAPTRFFLLSSRFVEKKNLPRVLDAYATYRGRAGEHAWSLVVLGDGELRPDLERQVTSLGLGACVLMPGFKQYDELPVWYGLASAFILASTSEQWGLVVNEAMAAGLPVLVSERCGCARDLVRDGVNGFTFDPYDTGQLADLMYRMAHGDVDREAMGRASQEIIADWGPERFAKGLEQAVEAALAVPPPKPSLLDRALLWALAHR